MIAEISTTSVNLDLATIHDFNNENLVMMVLGCYVVVKKPVLQFLLNILYMCHIVLIHVFLITMAVVTIGLKSLEKVVIVQTLQALCLLLVGLVLPGSRLFTDRSMNAALELIRSGVYQYEGEVPDERQREIKSERVGEVRKTMYWVTKLTFFCAFSNTFLMPLMKYLSNKETNMNEALNPYLPLPIFMPFDTKSSSWVFSFAFFTNGVFFFFLYGTINCLVETYLSCALQLIAQLEILNHTLRNLEKRARLMLAKDNGAYQDVPTESLYSTTDFQTHLYLCLRQNVLHHLVIMRLTKAVSPFLEAINSVSILSFSIVLAASIFLIAENPSINIALIGTLLSDVICYYEMCKVGQEITDKSIEISDSLYSTPWYSCDKRFSVLLRMMFVNTQKPIIIRARGFNASASVGTYGDMMTAAYKIVNILR